MSQIMPAASTTIFFIFFGIDKKGLPVIEYLLTNNE